MALSNAVPAGHLVPRIVTAERDEAVAFERQALDAGHEGIMAKALDPDKSPQEADTLDAVRAIHEASLGASKGSTD